jgi:RimJ/RimL family protein N-acetyltransferase
MGDEGSDVADVPGVERVRLRDGSEIFVRQIRAEDKELLRTALEHLSPESRYRRFFAPVKRLTEGQLAYFTEVDHHDHEALLALTENGEAIGVARYIRLAERPAAAEIAVTVTDAWQGRGVATELLRRLVARAREEGIETFTATCLASNHDVLEVLEPLGVTHFSHPDAGVLGLEIDLPTQVTRGEALHRTLRGAASGELDFRHPRAETAAGTAGQG